jgi:hypothetical protein
MIHSSPPVKLCDVCSAWLRREGKPVSRARRAVKVIVVLASPDKLRSAICGPCLKQYLTSGGVILEEHPVPTAAPNLRSRRRRRVAARQIAKL